MTIGRVLFVPVVLTCLCSLAGCSGSATASHDAMQSGSSSSGPGHTRTYYIAADEVSWDYVPGGKDGITGKPFQEIGFFKAGVKPGAPPASRPVSTSYVKALYREYTDATFKTLKPRTPAWEHLGFLGPVIHAEVGDTIRITFRNNGKKPYSMHPHGVFYNKDSEGAPYDDGTSGTNKADDGVPPGGTYEYVWQVPERAGPASMDVSSVMWMYHSHTEEVKDPNTGLMGPMIVTGRGQANADGSPKDVDRELMIMFAQIHEEDSWYAEKNMPTLAKDEPVAPFPPQQNFYPFFVTFSINGFEHGSMPLPALTVKKGQRVRWYVFAGTNDFDAHTPHWHGNTVVVNKMRMDVTSLLPMQMVTADMAPDNVGTWLLHCHVSFHNTAGMNVRYAVSE
jgi:FtsP/CotA-like multicopper oxidase with cupredoxin domain